jgi:hypothetical protein
VGGSDYRVPIQEINVVIPAEEVPIIAIIYVQSAILFERPDL